MIWEVFTCSVIHTKVVWQCENTEGRLIIIYSMLKSAVYPVFATEVNSIVGVVNSLLDNILETPDVLVYFGIECNL